MTHYKELIDILGLIYEVRALGVGKHLFSLTTHFYDMYCNVQLEYNLCNSRKKKKRKEKKKKKKSINGTKIKSIRSLINYLNVTEFKGSLFISLDIKHVVVYGINVLNYASLT